LFWPQAFIAGIELPDHVPEEERMSQPERLRDLVPGTLDSDLVLERQNAGWRLVAVEWERTADSNTYTGYVEVPFGLRIAPDCRHLEEHPVEAEILRTVMQGVVNDHPLSRIADDLNLRGYNTRSGERWNPARVFRLMPSLVDSGPRIFSEPEWPERRKSA
jgi:hypothetical protein